LKPFEPIRIDTSAPAAPVKYVPFFYIDDTEYLIPEKVPAHVVTQYFKDVRARGEDYALATAVIELVGEDAWDALNDIEQVEDEEMQKIMNVISDLLMGGMKKALGKSRAERRR
jgi:hypothetical protein